MLVQALGKVIVWHLRSILFYCAGAEVDVHAGRVDATVSGHEPGGYLGGLSR